MQERIAAETKTRLYSSTKSFFEDFERQLPKQLEEARSSNDVAEIRKGEDWKIELDTIQRSLDAGDPGPAKKKILSMIERNLEHARNDVPSSAETMRELAYYLRELEVPGPKREIADQSEMPSEEKMEGRTTKDIEPDTRNIEELERSINELETTENQLRKSLSEIQDQKRKLKESLRRAHLSKLRDEISM